MTMDNAPELRRRDDKRIDTLERKIDRVADAVSAIERLLITEPEASPLGRSLLNRARENRTLIDALRHDFEAFRREEFKPIDDWWNQTKGAWRFVLAVGVTLGMVGTVLGILSYFGGPR